MLTTRMTRIGADKNGVQMKLIGTDRKRTRRTRIQRMIADDFETDGIPAAPIGAYPSNPRYPCANFFAHR